MSQPLNVFLAFMVLIGSSVVGFAAGLKEPTGVQSSSSTGVPEVAVIFQPSRSKKQPTMISEDGTAVGEIPEETLLETTVSGGDLEAAIAEGKVDVARLGRFASKVVRNGKRYARIKIPLAVQLADGKVAEPGRIVYIDLEEAAELGLVQASSVRVIANDSEKLQKLADLINRGIEDNRVVPPRKDTRDQVAKEAQETPYLEDIPVPLLPAVSSNQTAHEELGQSANSGADPHAGSTGNQLDDEASPLNTERFLSSPTCGCAEPACVQTSYFGPRRSIRTQNGRMSSSNHSGLDVGGRPGTPIIAAAKGCVERTLRNPRNGFGLTVYLKHEGGFSTQYSHLQGFTPGLREGQCFRKGETIGRMGATGNCTGPHLHFGVYKNGYAVNPLHHLAVRTNAELSQACRGPVGSPTTLQEIEQSHSTRATSRRTQPRAASGRSQPSRSNRARQ